MKKATSESERELSSDEEPPPANREDKEENASSVSKFENDEEPIDRSPLKMAQQLAKKRKVVSAKARRQAMIEQRKTDVQVRRPKLDANRTLPLPEDMAWADKKEKIIVDWEVRHVNVFLITTLLKTTGIFVMT